ncbi:hypothetical protein SEEM841_10846 [Salmonella enterica subsp. enterica serovar Senftenberg str. 423984-1]|nr:hypothetical protein SEEM841_10846 [Salmonella enterica subsp. enterica serovar Senftenberg str. 423984-1]
MMTITVRNFAASRSLKKGENCTTMGIFAPFNSNKHSTIIISGIKKRT